MLEMSNILVGHDRHYHRIMSAESNPEYVTVRPLAYAPEIGTKGLNSTPDSGASFSCRYTTSNVIDCLLRRIYVVDFWSVCQGPYVRYATTAFILY